MSNRQFSNSKKIQLSKPKVLSEEVIDLHIRDMELKK